jgi:hypothetical protein
MLLTKTKTTVVGFVQTICAVAILRVTDGKIKTIEPVFGQIKQARGFQQFLLRGLSKVSAEWDLICLGHSVLKLFRSNWRPTLA